MSTSVTGKEPDLIKDKVPLTLEREDLNRNGLMEVSVPYDYCPNIKIYWLQQHLELYAVPFQACDCYVWDRKISAPPQALYLAAKMSGITFTGPGADRLKKYLNDNIEPALSEENNTFHRH